MRVLAGMLLMAAASSAAMGAVCGEPSYFAVAAGQAVAAASLGCRAWE